MLSFPLCARLQLSAREELDVSAIGFSVPMSEHRHWVYIEGKVTCKNK